MANTTIKDPGVHLGSAIDMKATHLTWGTEIGVSVPDAVGGSKIPNSTCDYMGTHNPIVELSGKFDGSAAGSVKTTVTYWNLRDLGISAQKKFLTDDTFTGSVYVKSIKWEKDANVEGENIINYNMTLVLTN